MSNGFQRQTLPGYSSSCQSGPREMKVFRIRYPVNQKKSLEIKAINFAKTMVSVERGTTRSDMYTLTECLWTSRPGRHHSQKLRRFGWNRILFGKWEIVTSNSTRGLALRQRMGLQSHPMCILGFSHFSLATSPLSQYTLLSSRVDVPNPLGEAWRD